MTSSGTFEISGDRWECGSEFDWPRLEPLAHVERHPWQANVSRYGSARDALRHLMAHGQQRGWRRLWLPSYYCPSVFPALDSSGLPVARYRDVPADPRGPAWPRLASGDAILVVNHFGLCAPPPPGLGGLGIEIIEDHTHDPWSPWATASDADWCVVSLRKTLPLPDGGLLWSPRGHQLPVPPPVSPERERGSAQRLAAMLLKALYLRGHPVPKDAFRQLAVSGERAFDTGSVAGMPSWTAPLLDLLPARAWREKRRDNAAHLTALLREAGGPTPIGPGPAHGLCPYGVIITLASDSDRDRVHAELTTRRIYPAILWPHDGALPDGIGSDELTFSRRMLCLHTDARYDRPDIVRVAEALVETARGADA